MPETDLHGPLLDVPKWVYDRSVPDHWYDSVVNLCVQWSTRTIHSIPLQNQPIDESKLLAVGLAMREVDLIAHVGHDIRSAWAVVPWPECIKQVRQEVCWTLSELSRRDRNRASGVTDLFDVYEPMRADNKASAAERGAKHDRRDGFEDEARMKDAYAALQRQIASDRKQHVEAQAHSLISNFTNAHAAPETTYQ